MTPIVQQVRDALAAQEGIAFAVLFGSAARGALRASSDIDLAVRFSGDAPGRGWELGGVIAALEEALGRRVDLVDLKATSSTVLGMEIARGVLVKGSTEELVRLRVRAYQAWRDFGPRFRRMARAQAAAIASQVRQ
ncbi:MAG TPA: nucleotidyltransferase domain-containing protein [Myxococcaceae bacterium]